MFSGTILVDVDGTVAGRNINVLLPLYNEYFHLELTEEQLQSIQTQREFERLEPVQAFRQRMGEERYIFLKQFVCYDPRHIAQARVLSGAVEGVQRLAGITECLGYCTARTSNNDKWSSSLRRVTYQWLQEHAFPCHDQVIYSDSPLGKLQIIAEELMTQKQPIVLIDDSYQSLVEDFSQLEEAQQAVLQQWLILGAFHSQEEEQAFPIRVLPLPGWEYIDHFIEWLDKSRRSEHVFA